MGKKIITVTLNPAIDKAVTVDGFVFGGLNRAQDSVTHVGGKGINVAKALANFKVPVVALGITARDQKEQIEEFLTSRGIEHRFIAVDGETRVNMKLTDKSVGITTEISTKGFRVTQNDVDECIEIILSYLDFAELLILSGSLPDGAPSDTYRRIITLANQRGVKVILDADGEALRQGIQAHPFAIKPNEYELLQLIGKNSDKKEIIEESRKLGIQLVALSMGEKGATFITENRVLTAKPPEVDVKSTVSAGDTMVAAIAYCTLKNMTLEQTLRFSVSAGSMTASKEGAEVCTLEEAESKLYEIKINERKL